MVSWRIWHCDGFASEARNRSSASYSNQKLPNRRSFFSFSPELPHHQRRNQHHGIQACTTLCGSTRTPKLRHPPQEQLATDLPPSVSPVYIARVRSLLDNEDWCQSLLGKKSNLI